MNRFLVFAASALLIISAAAAVIGSGVFLVDAVAAILSGGAHDNVIPWLLVLVPREFWYSASVGAALIAAVCIYLRVARHM